jgi:hypothetical protein
MGRSLVSELDDSHDLQALRERVAAARAGLASTPLSKERGTGPADPATGESWHRGNVLGHVSEMLDYWTAQIQRAVEGSGTMGRDQQGATSRRAGIDQGDAAAELELKKRVDEGIGRVLVMLAAMKPGDLERTVVFSNREGTREARVGELLQTLIVVHLEDHIEQLASLP